MSQTFHLRFSDAKALLHLVGELGDLRADPVARKRHMLQGLSGLVGAVTALTFRYDFCPAVMGITELHLVGWPDPRVEERIREAVQTNDPPDPSLPALSRHLMQQQFKLTTVRREQVLSDELWYGSKHVQELRRPTGCDDYVISIRPRFHPFCADGITLNRPWGDPVRFTDRERTLLHVFHASVDWLYIDPPHESTGDRPELTRRLREVVDLLKHGYSEKQVAIKLQLSRHTVHDYVKTIYRHYNVSTRSQLLSRWL